MSPPYLDRLDPARQEIFKKLEKFSDKFVLAGGTAIMLQIGHRQSYDFDLFSEKPLNKNLLFKDVKLVFGADITPMIANSDLCLFKLPSGVETHFVFQPYKNLKNPVPSVSIPLAYIDDLAANKANTIGRRGAWRDYVDLFFFLKWRLYSLEKIIRLTNRKFKGEFNDKLFLEQLTYFDDLDIIPTIFIKESYTSSQIKSYLEKETEKYVKKIL